MITIVYGAIILKDQLKDYQYRGEAMEYKNFIDFMLETYEGKIKQDNRSDDDDDLKTTTRVGRPPNIRVPYKLGASKPTRGRIFRTTGHETLPRFVGKWFERKDNPNTQELYYASMLLVLNPWINLTDLKENHGTFEASWTEFSQQLTQAGKIFVANVDYYHECLDSAEARREEPYPEGNDLRESEEQPTDETAQLMADLFDDHMDITLTEEDVEHARNKKHDPREELQANIALNIANDIGILFIDKTAGDNLLPKPSVASKATSNMMDTIRNWDSYLKSARRKPIVVEESTIHVLDPLANACDASLFPINIVKLPCIQPQVQSTSNQCDDMEIIATGNQNTRPIYNLLNEDQKRAHDIVYDILLQHLSGSFAHQFWI